METLTCENYHRTSLSQNKPWTETFNFWNHYAVNKHHSVNSLVQNEQADETKLEQVPVGVRKLGNT